MRFSQYREEEVAISLTPLIDVVFLLLIFFMISTTFSKESQLNLRLPTSDLPLETTLEEEVILISISEQGQYVLKRGKVLDIIIIASQTRRAFQYCKLRKCLNQRLNFYQKEKVRDMPPL